MVSPMWVALLALLMVGVGPVSSFGVYESNSLQRSESPQEQLQFSIFMGLQYYGPPAEQQTYERVAAAARKLDPAPLFVSVCADHNDTGGGAENRTGDPGDGGRIVPICDLGDAQAAAVRRGVALLAEAGAKVLHYTHTRLTYYPNGSEYRCCDCCEPLPYVKTRVENETKNFPDDGIFIDNVVANSAWLSYYSNIASAARIADPHRPVGMNENCAHAGDARCSPYCEYFGHSSAECSDCRTSRCSTMPESFMDLADVHLLSEGYAADSDYQTNATFNLTGNIAHRNKMSMFTYNATSSEWRGLIDKAAAAGFTKFWVSDTIPGPATTSFLTLPPWFEEMVDYIHGMNVK